MPLDNKEKRIAELQTIIDSFSSRFASLLKDNNCQFVNTPAKAIAEAYELLLDNVIKKFLNEGAKAQVYKVVSGLELATIYIQPIKSPNLNVAVKLNAILAFTIAGSFLLQEKFNNNFPTFQSNFKDECNSVLQNHMEFLHYLLVEDLYNLPVFSNSVYWQAYELIVKFDTR